MFWTRKRRESAAERRLRRQVAELSRELSGVQSELESERRRLAVANAEIESLAAVVARDRARIRAESARFAAERAEAEGVTGGRTHGGI